MFSLEELDLLVDAMRANGVVALTLEDEGETLQLKLGEAVTQAGTQANACEPQSTAPMSTFVGLGSVKSSAIGRFVPRGADDGLAVLDGSAMVGKDEILGYIAQGQSLVPLITSKAGRLTGDVPEEGTIFGFGDIVFELEVGP